MKRSVNIRFRSAHYRPDIDGLRAIAVCGVILYHLQSIDFLPGGFLGVDIFFVISGFLITNLILPTIQNGSFSFKKFYLRRARRLLPAFIVVAFSSTAVSWFVLDPSRMLDFVKSLFFAVFGLSNMHFMFQDPYWADSASTLPLLHTWSLGVEEQFYLVFPTLLIVVTKFLGKYSRLALFSVIAFLSLLLALWVFELNPTYAFYLFPTRAWEMLVGVLLSLVLDDRKILIPKSVAAFSAGMGLLLIGISYSYFGLFISAPGLLTVVPVTGAALIIFGGLTANPVSKVLGFRPLVSCGLISYSLYLWHYPIIVLGGVTVPLGPRGEVVAVALAVTLAILTYFLIETPFRRSKHTWPSVAFSFGGIATILVFCTAAVGTAGFEIRVAGPPWPEKPSLDSQFGRVTKAENRRGGILLFGDSHMQRLVVSLSKNATEFGFDFTNGTVTACPFFLGITRLNVPGCTADFQAERLALAATNPSSFVVVGSRFPYFIESSGFDNTEGGVEDVGRPLFVLPGAGLDPGLDAQKVLVQEALKFTIESLLKQGHTVVVVYPIPEVGWDLPLEILRRQSLSQQSSIFGFTVPLGIQERLLPGLNSWPLADPVTTSHDTYVKRTQTTFDVLDSFTSDRIIRIYPNKIFCNEQKGSRCITHDNNHIYYTDGDHLSTAGARLVADEIIKKIEKSG